MQFDLRNDDPGDATYAAFYADCLHEVLPVTSGCRLTLVYNLIRQGKGRAPEPPDYTDEQRDVAALLRRWRGLMDLSEHDGEVLPVGARLHRGRFRFPGPEGG